ncbi:MAG: cytochrome P450 [bacterium]|nr:hypothetical protein [Deltaproteobacteria bacterium]MCP4903723.1 cytochrome P450 [bacterium]
MSAQTDAPSIMIDSEAARRNPFEVLERLREEDPVHWVEEMDCWLISRYSDVRSLFTDPRLSPDRRKWAHYVRPAEKSIFRWIDDHGLVAVSRKEHARQRKLFASGLTPRGVERMDGQIREVVARFAQPLKGRKGVVDIMEEFTTPIPNAVISAITGVGGSDVDEDRFSQLAQETIQGFFGFVSDEIRDRAESAYVELSGWVRGTVRARKGSPREDLISDLLAARHGEDKLTEDDVIAQVSIMLAAGSETTATGGMLALSTLLDHPEALERVRKDRSLIPQTVSEVLRYAFGGLSGMQRFAVEDFDLHGRKIRKGQQLLLSIGGASHDPAVYPHPEQFDIDRNPKDLLTFGIGPHFCMGSNLARGELVCMIDAAMDFLPVGATVLHEEKEFQTLGLFERVVTCPVDFGS